MKVAVIYSGEPRTFAGVQKQHASFLEGLYVHTYHSTWTKTSKEDKDLIRSAPRFKSLQEVDYKIPDRPDLLKFEELLLRNKQNHPIFMLGRIQYMTAMSFLPLYYTKDNYDYVVRLRYDFIYEGKLVDYLQDIGPRDLLITRKMGGKSSPINIWDGFAAGDPNIMGWYFDFHRWLPFSLFNKDVLNWKFQPEFVYGTYVRMCQLNVRDCGVQPHHVYPEGKDVDWHRTTRTIQYYRDLAQFHPNWYKQREGKLIIENDSPTVEDKLIIDTLKEEGYQCDEV